jgi:hypothetical protein
MRKAKGLSLQDYPYPGISTNTITTTNPTTSSSILGGLLGPILGAGLLAAGGLGMSQLISKSSIQIPIPQVAQQAPASAIFDEVTYEIQADGTQKEIQRKPGAFKYP